MKNSNLRFTISLIFCLPFIIAVAQKTSGYKITKTFHVASLGGWDYPAVNANSNKLYLSHGMQVNILDKTTGDSLGVILNTTGVHGIAFVDALGGRTAHAGSWSVARTPRHQRHRPPQ